MTKTRHAITAAALLALLALLALPLAAQTGDDSTSAATVAASPIAMDASGARSLLDHPRALARFLRLSAAQLTELNGFWQTLQGTVQPLRQARVPLCQQLIADLAATAPNDAAVGADSISLHDSRQSILAARKTFDTSFSAILNPNQLIAYDALKQLALAIDPDYSPIGDCQRPNS
jgi:hypothetical protein